LDGTGHIAGFPTRPEQLNLTVASPLSGRWNPEMEMKEEDDAMTGVARLSRS